MRKKLKRLFKTVYLPLCIVALFGLLFWLCEHDFWLASLKLSGLAAKAADADVVGVRVMANPEAYSPLSWYYKNIKNQGAPQELEVDGYQAIRDGRSVYVNAANVNGPPVEAGNKIEKELFTNIYILSYNQDAAKATTDIFGQILKYWKFNIELMDDPGKGNCLPQSAQSCQVDADCRGNWLGYTCLANALGSRVCTKKCFIDADCGGKNEHCSSLKARLIRDVERLADINEVNLALQIYNAARGGFPTLPAGSYLPNKTLSVWPSWNDTLGKSLGYVLPLDPINKLGVCRPESADLNKLYDPQTCWNETAKLFAVDAFNQPEINESAKLLPDDSWAYVYALNQKANRYKFCANFETPYSHKLRKYHDCGGEWQGELQQNEPRITIGNCFRPEGAFLRCYVSVDSLYDVDWSKAILEPTAPNSWPAWQAAGWTWGSGKTGLALAPTSNKNQKELKAAKVDLPQGKDSQTFNFKLTVYDIHGNKNSTGGAINICNLPTCGVDAECGKVANRCGIDFYCPACPAGQKCVSNKCVRE